jgi:Meckel syndrome type 1 protein
MDWLTPYLTYLIAALVILAVVILAILVIKAVGGRVRGRRGSRLGVSEYHEVDKTRRLVLVRRDGVEHLLMIGGERDLVIETGIAGYAAIGTDPAMSRRPAMRPEAVPRASTENLNDPAAASRPAPRPAVFGDRLPSLRPTGRDEPRLATGRKFESDETS